MHVVTNIDNIEIYKMHSESSPPPASVLRGSSVLARWHENTHKGSLLYIPFLNLPF